MKVRIIEVKNSIFWQSFNPSTPSISLSICKYTIMVRFKNRWVLFQIVHEPVIDPRGKVIYPKTQFEVTDGMISKTIFQAVEENYGQFGKGQGTLSVKWFNPITQIGILRVPRDFTNMFLSALFFIRQIETIPCSFQILHVSGTIIFIQQEAIDWDRRFYIKEQSEAEKRGKKIPKQCDQKRE
ncbi:hypothetical protein BDF20DRAFT_863134 [Mycotypha africana]|uniref:uncharacterized protein n=1 Tax=Mycotypha africana TaxID=64632 RepID=UPI00230009AE|nr:uncharacterized protein BDF20DRAFT_863134 [Mycotypha africana]KAI8981770.1 hypothetical protein BDF20DRAFT_863134 [Mycotypha africana]